MTRLEGCKQIMAALGVSDYKTMRRYEDAGAPIYKDRMGRRWAWEQELDQWLYPQPHKSQ